MELLTPTDDLQQMIRDLDSIKASLLAAVTTLLKERRRKQGLKQGVAGDTIEEKPEQKRIKFSSG
jgi:hypothetical protein